jgi:uncharacterized alkaline shock family protein YloU
VTWSSRTPNSGKKNDAPIGRAASVLYHRKRRAQELEEMDEREVGRVVRSAAESVYGVSAVVGSGWADRLAARLGMGSSGVTVTRTPALRVTIDLRVAETVPAHQVAANVAEKVRYVVERDLSTPIDHLEVKVDGQPIDLSNPPTPPAMESSAP